MFWHGEARVVVAWVWWKSRTGHGPWGAPLSRYLIFWRRNHHFFWHTVFEHGETMWNARGDIQSVLWWSVYMSSYMDVSKNNGTPKSSQFNRCFPLFSPSILGYISLFLGVPPIYLHTRCVGRMGLLTFFRRSASVGILPWWLQHGPQLQPSLPRSRIMATSPPDFWSIDPDSIFPPNSPQNKEQIRKTKFPEKWWNSGRMGSKVVCWGWNFSTQHPKIPRRKAVVKQPVAPLRSDATHATNATNATSFTEATTTGEESWILKTYLQLGRLDVHWNYKLRIMKLSSVNFGYINPACVCYEKLCFSLMDVMVTK